MLEGPRRLKGGAVAGINTLAKVPATPVYLFGRGMELNETIVEADLHDCLYRQTKGGKTKAGIEVPPDLEICCPRCTEWLHIDGHKKTIHVRYLPQPIKFAHPISGELCVQMAVVSIEEVLHCPQPQGKTVCGLRFRITENVMCRV